MNKIELYDLAIKSVERYKESGEELTDFDVFMDEIEEKYKRA